MKRSDEARLYRPVTRWFYVGFLASFVLLAFVNRTYVHIPGGNAVAEVPLWRFYCFSVPELFKSKPLLGPDSEIGSSLLTVLLQHLGVSVSTGIVAFGVARRRQSRALNAAWTDFQHDETKG